MGWYVAECQRQNRAFLTFSGGIDNKIFLLINAKSTANYCN
nr:MAG TPA: Queuosine biosynthesis protein QueC [Caudoviricetes sp.]